MSDGSALTKVTCDYTDFTVTLHPFVCSITSGDIVLHEHRAIKWLLPTELSSLEWPEADMPVIEEYLASKVLPSGRNDSR